MCGFFVFVLVTCKKEKMRCQMANCSETVDTFGFVVMLRWLENAAWDNSEIVRDKCEKKRKVN